MLAPYKLNFRNPTGSYGNLFGTGVDGDVVLTNNWNIPIAENSGHIFKNYRNLTINSGVTLSTSNRCAGLFIKVQDTLTLNGTIDMTGKAAYRTDKGNIPLHPWIDYLRGVVMKIKDQPLINYILENIVTIPADCAAPEQAGVNGQTGGGGRGGKAIANASGALEAQGGNGESGYCFGGGCAGSGGWARKDALHGVNAIINGDNALPNCERGGIRVGNGLEGNKSGAGASPSGGVIIIMAKRIISNNGTITSRGTQGQVGTYKNGGYGVHDNVWFHFCECAGHGGSSGGGSAIVFYVYKNGNINYNFNGGAGIPQTAQTYWSDGNPVATATAVATNPGGAGSFKEIQVPEKFILGRYD